MSPVAFINVGNETHYDCHYCCPFDLDRNLQTSKARHSKLKKPSTRLVSLFTSAASNQRGCPKDRSWEAPVGLPEGGGGGR